jgi:hypothetical protein
VRADPARLLCVFDESGERMSEALREYFLSITSAALLCAVMQALVPPGGVRKVAGLIAGMVMIITVLSPLTTLDMPDMAQIFAKLQMEQNADQSGVEVRSRELVAQIVKDQCESKIVDKAVSLGADVQADVTVETESEYPYPAEVTITGSYTDLQKRSLERYIEENLAIAESDQTWK